MAANNLRGTTTSASWNLTYLISFARNVVAVQCSMVFVHKMKTVSVASMLLVSPGLPLATALVVIVIVLAIANRDFLTNLLLRVLLIGVAVGYGPTGIVLVYWMDFLMWFSV